MRAAVTFLLSCVLISSTRGQIIEEPYAFTTVAGAPLSVAKDGGGSGARFKEFKSLATDQAGNVYAVDGSGVRKITPGGVVTTLARGDFRDIAANRLGEVFVVDPTGTIFRITQLGTLARSKGLPQAVQIAFDRSNNLYVLTANEVLKFLPSGTSIKVATTAGIQSRPGWPITITDIAVDSQGTIYAANLFAGAIFKSALAGTFEPFVGVVTEPGYKDGTGPNARLSQPTALATDPAGNIYFIDGGFHFVRKIAPDATVSTVPGWDKVLDRPYTPLCTGCNFTGPNTLAADDSGNLYVGALNTTLLRGKSPEPPVILAGMEGGPGFVDGSKDSARFGGYLGPYTLFTSPEPTGLDALAMDTAGNIYASDPVNGSIRKVSPEGEVSTLARGFGRSSLVLDPATNLFVAFYTTVSMLTPAGEITTIAGKMGETGNVDGPGELARFGSQDLYRNVTGLGALTRDRLGNLYAFDVGNGSLRKLAPSGTNWSVSTVTNFLTSAGTQIPLGRISALASSANGDLYAVQGYAISRLVSVGSNWMITTIAGSTNESGYKDGSGATARFGSQYDAPLGLAVDSNGNIFVSDTANYRIRKVAPDGYVTTIGGGSFTSDDGIGSAVGFHGPRGITANSSGTIFIADYGHFTLRKGFLAPQIETRTCAYFNGTFHVSAATPAGTATIIETSSNLIDWTPCMTNLIGGTLDFNDPFPPSSSNRFYRTRVP